MSSSNRSWISQYAFALNEQNKLIWGLGYRRYSDAYRQAMLGSMIPSNLDYDLFSAFVQDQIDLIPHELELTVGARLEHNDFSGWEFQPNVRLLWSPYAKHRLWAAISRAVHTPSRFDNGGILSVVAAPPQSPLNLPVLVFFRAIRSLSRKN